MLNLKGEVQIKGSVNVRTEKHGDENHTFMDIKCSTLVKREQLKKLTREELIVQALFNEPSQGHFEPLLGGKIGPIPLLGKFEKVPVSFVCGVNDEEIEFETTTICKMSIDPQIGGITLFKFTVQTEINGGGKKLFDYAGTSQKFDMKLGKLSITKEDQMELPMGDGDGKNEAASDARLEDAIAKDDQEQQAAENGADDPEQAGGKPKRVRASRSKPAVAARKAKS